MEKPLSLTLRYSANIAGDLALLPRMTTFLQRLGAEDGESALLLDLGGTCAESVWHCRATGGRSALIVLDGMGYHAANVAGALDAEHREKLAAQVTLALVDGVRDWAYHVPPVRDPSIVVTLRPRLLNGAARLQIALAPSAETRIAGNALWLPLLRDRRAANHVPPLEHLHVQPARAKYPAATSPLCPAPTMTAFFFRPCKPSAATP